MEALHELLNQYRELSQEQRGKGTLFELLIKDFLLNDPAYKSQFTEAWTFKEWAAIQGKYQNDAGIDLVAQRADEAGFCAIQCKFYDANHRMQKGDIDSFFTASGKIEFTSRLIVDTIGREWSKPAEDALEGQSIPVQRIGLSDLENSTIDWSVYTPNQPVKHKDKKTLRPHQVKALAAVQEGLEFADRGKLIMACGTGKTFTGLKIAEKLAGAGKQVLFLVPSLSLMSQTITEWTAESEITLRSFAVCSDVQVGKRRESDDLADIPVFDLQYPATTDATKLAQKISNAHNADDMTVVFSTYQSIQVISDAQKANGLPAFDLIICDEAHRTTGATLEDALESNFVKIHDNDFIAGKKRIYMTATPRIFSDTIKTKAKEVDATLASMDNPDLYGDTLFELSFSYAVQNGLLTDYKVIVLAMDENVVSESMQKRFTDTNNELILDDLTKIVGCYRALSKLDITTDVVADPAPMKRAVAFCRDIKSSKRIVSEFTSVVQDYLAHQPLLNNQHALNCELDHVDGTFNAGSRNTLLSWLKADAPENTCRILSNARCLSEGVDVPALDAILFLHPRKSQIDVVQSVGRVMRRSEGKNMGYVILPIGVPANMTPEEALKDNEKYKVVWQILNALRAHDDRMDATINKIDMGVNVGGRIEIISNTLPEKNAKKPDGSGIGDGGNDNGDEIETEGKGKSTPAQPSFDFDEFQKAILAKIVKKCGTREYWGDWANGIARIAQTHITRITAALANKNSAAYASFNHFLSEIRDDLNESISETDAIEMLAQHIITKPIFDALFEGYSFTQHNPVSQAMQSVLSNLDGQHLEKEQVELQDFYDRVKRQIGDVKTADAKQKIITDLYDKFFKNAFPRMTEKLGIVYTPVPVVDFIIHSVNDALKSEFGKTLGDENVHIIDPFTGTGTFITRLLQSGLIAPEQLTHKYKKEIHANEIVLLAYYIAAINIESVYHDLMHKGDGEYVPFEGICLTDTFQLYEKEDLVSTVMEVNSGRRKRQKKLKLTVIMGNPPYSAGQKSANDNNANVIYPDLDSKIRSTYAAQSTATNKNALYDSYIRSIRWASDRLAGDDGKGCGVMGFVSNAGWIDANTADGLRKCLAEEFASIYVFHLRGNALLSGEPRRKEGGNVFKDGTRTPISVSLFIRNPNATEHGRIVMHDIGDYLTREEKLTKISEFKSIDGITAANGWQPINPDKHGDWVGQRDDSFGRFISLGDKKDKTSVAVFEKYSGGVKTNRDVWCYNSSKQSLSRNMGKTIDFYNQQLQRYERACHGLIKAQYPSVDGFLSADLTKISWSGNIKADVSRFKSHTFDKKSLGHALYRPFSKQWMYYGREFNERVYQMPKIFPNATAENRVIYVSGLGGTGKDSSALMVDIIPDLNMQHSGGQGFPRHIYDADVEPSRAEPSRAEPLYTDRTDSTGQSRHLLDGLGDTEGLFSADDGRIARHSVASERAVLSAVSVRHSGGGEMIVHPNLNQGENGDLFGDVPSKNKPQTAVQRRDGISDGGLVHFAAAYPSETITKEDVFYYIYGLLHSEDYKARYADSLSKELPRIPCVKKAADFWAFSQSGRALADLHVDYEKVEMYPVRFEGGELLLSTLDDVDFRVEQMKFGKKSKMMDKVTGKTVDKTTVVYNHKITMTEIPLEAYDYIVNGKPALEWVMERQAVKTYKDSGIVNDANDWAIETMGNARYPLELFQRVITVSLETMKIVRALPRLDISVADE